MRGAETTDSTATVDHLLSSDRLVATAVLCILNNFVAHSRTDVQISFRQINISPHDQQNRWTRLALLSFVSCASGSPSPCNLVHNGKKSPAPLELFRFAVSPKPRAMALLTRKYILSANFQKKLSSATKRIIGQIRGDRTPSITIWRAYSQQ